MIDFIIRDCGHGEWLPIITVTATGKELYRGDRVPSGFLALAKAQAVWENSETGNVVDFKKVNNL